LSFLVFGEGFEFGHTVGLEVALEVVSIFRVLLEDLQSREDCARVPLLALVLPYQVLVQQFVHFVVLLFQAEEDRRHRPCDKHTQGYDPQGASFRVHSVFIVEEGFVVDAETVVFRQFDLQRLKVYIFPRFIGRPVVRSFLRCLRTLTYEFRVLRLLCDFRLLLPALLHDSVGLCDLLEGFPRTRVIRSHVWVVLHDCLGPTQRLVRHFRFIQSSRGGQAEHRVGRTGETEVTEHQSAQHVRRIYMRRAVSAVQPPTWEGCVRALRRQDTDSSSALRLLRSVLVRPESPSIPQLESVLYSLYEKRTRGAADVVRQILTRAEPLVSTADSRTLCQLLNKAYLLNREDHRSFGTGFASLAERLDEVDIKGKVTLMHLLAKLGRNNDKLVERMREGLKKDLAPGHMDAHQTAVYLCALFHLISNCTVPEQTLIHAALHSNCWSFYPKHILILISYCPAALMPQVHPLLLPLLQFIVKHNLITEATLS